MYTSYNLAFLATDGKVLTAHHKSLNFLKENVEIRYKNILDHFLDEMDTRQFFSKKEQMQKTTLNVLSIEHKKDILLKLHVFSSKSHECV